MPDEYKCDGAAAIMRRINRAWIDGEVQDLRSMLHPEMIMAFPGFTGRSQGRDGFLAGFRDFCENATVHEFREHDQQVDVAGDTSVVTFRYEMIYERSPRKYQSSGRDLWVFQKQGEAWLAVWRTMLEVEESEVEGMLA